MPLPDHSTVWPPKNLAAAYQSYQETDAWYTGSADALSNVYTLTSTHASASIWGRVKRFFWGTPTPTTTNQRPNKLHVPIAAEVSRMSAMQLYSEMPTCSFSSNAEDTDQTTMSERQAKAATARLTVLLDDNAHARLLEGAEYGSAHGGVFERISWDKTVVPDGPFITTVPADAAVPEFRWGRLSAVTFWSILETPQNTTGVWTLLERHEPGSIEFGLYNSEENGQLGMRVPLAEHDATAHLAAVVNQNSSVETGSELLTAVYKPNMGPNKKLRKDPIAGNLGRSDYDDAMDLMDALDEAFSSWMRDVRLGKARIMVPQGLLQNNGAGNGATFNGDQEIFTELGQQVGSLNPGAGSAGAQSFMTMFQPAIRWMEHLNTTTALIERIYSACGFSTSTFGDAGDKQMTATESNNREKLTSLTRSAKVLLERPQDVHLFSALMDVDEAVFNGPGRGTAKPDVEFADATAESPTIIALMLRDLNLAEVASIKTRVQMLHPDWDEKQVDEEVQQIRVDYSMLPDPSMKNLWAAVAENGSATGGVDVKALQGSNAPEPADGNPAGV